jgi:DNA-binding beta-propeller fold protein YncE
MPHVFVGTVTIDGAPAPDGSDITVWLSQFDGPAGVAISSGGEYSVLANQHGSESFSGETLIFKINGQNSGETAVWEKGGATILDLSLN